MSSQGPPPGKGRVQRRHYPLPPPHNNGSENIAPRGMVPSPHQSIQQPNPTNVHSHPSTSSVEHAEGSSVCHQTEQNDAEKAALTHRLNALFAENIGMQAQLSAHDLLSGTATRSSSSQSLRTSSTAEIALSPAGRKYLSGAELLQAAKLSVERGVRTAMEDWNRDQSASLLSNFASTPTRSLSLGSRTQQKKIGRSEYPTGIIHSNKPSPIASARERRQRPLSQILCDAECFEDLVANSSTISDKSMFLKEWFNGSRKLMFCLPHGVGKTTLLTMTASFLRHKHQNSPFQHCGGDPFDRFPFKILEEEIFCQLNVHQWPVVFVTFKNIWGATLKELMDNFKSMLWSLYKEHGFLKQWLRENGHRDACTTEQFFVDNFHDRKLATALVDLCEFVCTSYKEQVVLIIDDYDKMLQWALISPEMTAAEVQQVYNTVKRCISATLDNPYKSRVLIAGTYRIELDDGAKVECFTMTPNNYSKYFGFLQSEFVQLCHEYGVDEMHQKAACKYYNGYTVFTKPAQPLYNTRSSVKFFHKFQSSEGKCVSIVSTTSTGQAFEMEIHHKEPEYMRYFEPLFKADRVIQTVHSLVNGEEVYCPLNQGIIKGQDLQDLRDSCSRVGKQLAKITDDGRNLFMRFLFASGYVIKVPQKRELIRPANEEMRKLLAQKLQKYYNDTYQLDIQIKRLLNGVTDELWGILHTPEGQNTVVAPQSCSQLERALSQLLHSLPEFLAYHTFPVTKEVSIYGNEHVVHFLLDIAAIRMPRWYKFASDFNLDMQYAPWVKPKKGKDPKVKRPDIIVMSADSKLGLTIEIKYDDKVLKRTTNKGRTTTKGEKPSKRQKERLRDALNQIGENGYLSLYSRDPNCTNLATIVALGVYADHNKEVVVGGIVRHRAGRSIADFVREVSEELMGLSLQNRELFGK